MKKINLALQGGGAHGAFTWGVLDALLCDENLEIAAISCASAGAMNAAALVSGWMRSPDDPRAGARANLKQFWQRIGQLPSLSNLPNFSKFWQPQSFSLHQNPWFIGFDLLSRMFSPYQLNPLNYNPLAEVVREVISVEAINECRAMQLFVCATHVQSGRVAVFSNHASPNTKTQDLSHEAILASACLPFSYQAVKVAGEYYWDGGYMGNPSLFPLYDNDVADILLVQINPLIRQDLPDTAAEIIGRVNEISFNSSLMLEMRAIAFVQKLLTEEKIDAKKYKRVLMHAIDGGQFLAGFGASSKHNTSWDFLQHLHDLGFESGQAWLKQHHQAIGQHATIDVREVFL